MLMYLRNTHDPKTGEHLPELQNNALADAVWDAGCNGFVGHMLEATIPQTAAEVLEQVREYERQYPEDCPAPLTEGEVRDALGALVAAGLAREVEGEEYEGTAIMVCGHLGRSWSSGWKRCMECPTDQTREG